MKIEMYTPEYKQAMEDICIATASERARTQKRHHDFSLLMYCDEYLDREKCLMLMADDKPVGYVLCAEDYSAWKQNMAPYAKQIEALGDPYPKRVHDGMAMYGAYASEYPAHMHIDILEQYTGGGNGTALFHALIEMLKKDGVKGLMLGVDLNNTRAVSFYKKMGFTPLNDMGLMGLKLQ
ncbi:MAG: GNAT family N-acetyltransferase [Lactimicrobium sp.]|jgi:ribosomal protein S18 acetylase RimI-like enzyme|uniref:GNAT family N-acetyltransferase n=1 Tax=Lactimicrobium sp. TaxID=2563780 RepID=UPI002F3575E0